MLSTSSVPQIFLDIAEVAERTGFVALDYETTGLNVTEDDILGISVAVTGASWWIPTPTDVTQKASWVRGVRYVLECRATKIWWKSWFDQAAHYKLGIPIYDDHHDAKVMWYILEPMDWCPNALKDRGSMEFGIPTIRYHDVDWNNPEQVARYAKQDAELTLKLYFLARERLIAAGLWEFYLRVYPAVCAACTEMRVTGIRVDRPKLVRLKSEFEVLRDQHLALVHKHKPGINPMAPAQVAKYLYHDLKLKPPFPEFNKLGASGHESTIKEVLKFMARQHEAAMAIKEYRRMVKLLTTYVDPLIEFSGQHPQRKVFSEFNPIGTDTGRASSSGGSIGRRFGFNFQNIPIRTDEGHKVRECFVPDDGYDWVKGDLSQIEMRVAAFVAQCESMIAAFNAGRDVHQELAESASLKRPDAKNAGFGYIYGMQAKRFALNYGYSLDEAKVIRRAYFQKWQEMASWHTRMELDVLGNLWSTTLFGRKHFLGFYPIKGGERHRKALNTPVQGTVADAINGSIAELWRMRKFLDLPFTFLAQVHDEIDVMARSDHSEMIASLVKKVMESSVNLGRIPVKSKVEITDRWATEDA